MGTEHDLLAELRRYNLLIPLLRMRIIKEAVGSEQPASEDLEKARAQFFQQNGLNDAEAVQGFLKQHGWSEEEVKELMCRARQPVSLEMKVGDGDETELLELLAGEEELPSEQVEVDCMKGDLRGLLEKLPELQGRVLRMRYGIDGGEPMNLTGIAKALGMSRDRTRRLEREGLALMRTSSFELEAYMVV